MRVINMSDLESFVEQATPEQRKVLFTLSDLHEQEVKLMDQIKRIYASKQSGIYSSDGMSITPCEDNDDAFVISFGPRKELTDVKKQTKYLVIKAVGLGMGNLGLIRRHYEEYFGKPLVGDNS